MVVKYGVPIFQGALGEEKRFNHEKCGDTRGRLYVKRVIDGWVYHCHNCAPSLSGKVFDHGRTPTETRDLLANLQEERSLKDENKVVRLPPDFTLDIPGTGMDWVFKYGITEREVEQFGFGYSPAMGRLILPVYHDYKGKKELVYWQGRTLKEVTKSNPKYLNYRGTKAAYFLRRKNESPNIVLVEDILSAIKVGRHTTALGLLGSHIPDELIKQLGSYDKVIVWLDPDKQKESIKFAQRIGSLLGKPAKPLLANYDPKEYTNDEIKRSLKETFS